MPHTYSNNNYVCAKNTLKADNLNPFILEFPSGTWCLF